MIDTKLIEEIRKDSFLTQDEIDEGIQYVTAEGVVNTYGFHPERLETHREEVREMLMQLPPQFRASEGGGWSFLQACVDKDGVQWGEHSDMEMLFCLGIALGLVSYPLPREFWNVMPGGMPYVTVLDM